MVDGVSGISAGTNVDTIKQIVQEVLEEALEAKEAQAAQEESIDEECVITEEGTGDSGAVDGSSEEKTGLAAIFSAISDMFASMIESIIKVMGSSNTEDVKDESAEQVSTENEKYTMSEDEKAYMTLHPDFVRELVAKEKFEDKYGRSYTDKGLRGKLNEHRLNRIMESVTDEEVQAYLQLNPDVIKNAIKMEKNPDMSGFLARYEQ